MRNEYKKFLTPSLKTASKETLRVVGLSSFGDNLSYLESERPEIIETFKQEISPIIDSYHDRFIFKYITNYVELFENEETVKVGSLMFTRNVPKKRVAESDIKIKAEEIRSKAKQ